ncbi:ATP-binding protein [Halodesulfovibrio marinisediminis]|uniref:TIGR00269 family protein n=1 Tax=Halodesulfovibrio marinisediminis DSM 17456 TaxID=1121457 RepID=A0A1N6F5Y0_9BACT|nr:ATP-binding protein [Halodesulfovibrio marinisediminis]SIN90702.1 TIGR00269 family protein [Halodesulfovibrio marinisediminis DSM 17456]
MKCKVCKATAVVSLPSHNTGFCADCFMSFYERSVERSIRRQKLFTFEDKILVALSGGKDSLACALVLKKLGYQVHGLHIDLAIPESSAAARGVVERFCATHDIPLIVKEMEEEDLQIPRVKKVLSRSVCSACGRIKRYFFNKVAMDEGFTALATGHNLDDEIARLFSNTLRWDIPHLSDQGPLLEAENGFARKVRPLFRLTEFENANYAFLNDLEYHYAPCPYSPGATSTAYKKLWNQLEEDMPGRKLAFYTAFLAHGREPFRQFEKEEGTKPVPCERCGYPTSAGICGVCRTRDAVAADSE